MDEFKVSYHVTTQTGTFSKNVEYSVYFVEAMTYTQAQHRFGKWADNRIGDYVILDIRRV